MMMRDKPSHAQRNLLLFSFI
uniref:Uncharacterized protein n=1 Tax=Anguilla anguilla TaxID=7936 RepID=A0A0E9V5K1_ANGAN